MAPPSTTMVGKPIGPIAYGAMNLTWVESPPDEKQSFATMRTALAAGANFFNGGEFYGPIEKNSNVLLHEYYKNHPEDVDKIVYCLKGGTVPGVGPPPKIDGGAENIRRSVEDSLAQLKGKDGKGPGRIDVFECARVDQNVPIEEQVRTLNELKKEGKIGGIGLSECKAETIRRASKVAKIDMVEVEVSMFTTDVLFNGIAEACAELDIPIVAFGAIGKGALAGKYPKSNAEIPEHDHRKHMPRFQDDALKANYALVEEVNEIAKKKGCTSGQVAIGWLLGLNNTTTPDGKKIGVVIPLPGSSAPERAEENSKVVELTKAEMKELWDIIERNPVTGHRYPETIAKFSEY